MIKSLIFLFLSVYSFADSDIADKVISNTTNTGNIVSVGGASFDLDLKLASVHVAVGSSNGTVTNVNTIIIHNKAKVHTVSLTAHNSGSVTNIGTKLNLNSIIIGN